MTEQKQNYQTPNFSQPIVSSSLSTLSIKFCKEEMIRNEMVKMENLIKHLESVDFYEKYGVGQFWFDESKDNFVQQCKKHLIRCSKKLADSSNYQ